MVQQKVISRTLHALPQQEAIKPKYSFFSIEKFEYSEAWNYVGLCSPSHFEILVISDGTGSVQIDSQQYLYNKNFVCVILPEQKRTYQFNRDTKGYYLCFSQDYLYPDTASMYCFSWSPYVYKGYDLDIEPNLNRPYGELKVLMDEMLIEFQNDHLFRNQVISGLLNLLLIDVARKLPIELRQLILPKNNMLTKKFTQLIKVNYVTKKQVGDYASLLCVSPSHLNATIKKNTRHTAKYHIQQQILSEAKRLLTINPSMKETAYCLGFEDPSHFSKFFKRNAGMNVKRFRETFL